MDTRGRKLLRGVAGILTAAVLMGAAYTTTAMASSIGLIDTADLLDIHAEADGSSEVVGQVMDEGHVAILATDDGWVKIQAGDIVGWVPDSNLIETEVSNEEAVEANQEVMEEIAEKAEETDSEPEEENTSEQEQPMQETQPAQEETDSGESQHSELEKEAETASETAAADLAETIMEAAVLEQEKESAEAFAREQAIAAQALWEEQQKMQQAAFEAAALAQEQAAQLQAQAEAQKQAILAANGITEEELYLLANIIYCEAGCEPYVGKVAVGNVVMNRVKSDHQPDTISEVIYAKGQFSPVRNGSLERALRNSSADASCYQAALEALAGSQPVGDKLYFRRINGRSGQIIGHHVFY